MGIDCDNTGCSDNQDGKCSDPRVLSCYNRTLHAIKRSKSMRTCANCGAAREVCPRCGQER